ncbi:MAG TPA: IS1634 family transposase, partial [Bacteroidales bacterium]|nr:IS1634 family transposase [Bacteroidales bacterium]
MDNFWRERLSRSRKGTQWYHVLQILTCYSLIDPGSEWRLHRQWYDGSAMGDLLGEDLRVAQINTLYRCMDKLQEHKDELFKFLRWRWGELFEVSFDVLLYDLTSTYFECDPPEHESKKKFGYSRDKRSDCVQVVIALIVTDDGFPIAYEVLAGNTKDDQTLADFLEKIERLYGKADRIWVMDRGIPTEETLQKMRESDPPVQYIVGTKRGKLTKLEQRFLELDWKKVKESVDVKILEEDGDMYVLARSAQRANKERAMRKRKLKKFWRRLHELREMKCLTRDKLLRKLGAAEKEAGLAARLVSVTVPGKDELVSSETFTFSLDRQRIKNARQREGKYIIRSNSHGEDGAVLWRRYIQLTEIELAFRNLKSDLNIRPIFHQRDDRIESHIFLRFLAYCIHVTLKKRLEAHAPGTTPREVLEKFTAMQMVDVHIPTTDGRELILSRYTQPEKDQKILLDLLSLQLPKQPPPKISRL